MAEVVAIAAGIGSILKALGTSGVYLKSAAGASLEAQAIAQQVHATEAILKSLKASLKTVHRSDDFYRIWAESTNIVLRNVIETVEGLNGKLGAQKGTARLSFWGKVKWPLSRDDSLQLQQHLQGYMQMLSIVQNAFLQGTIQNVQQSAQAIDDIITEIGAPTASLVSRSSDPWSAASPETVLPSDSASQLGAEVDSKRTVVSPKGKRLWSFGKTQRSLSDPDVKHSKSFPAPIKVPDTTWVIQPDDVGPDIANSERICGHSQVTALSVEVETAPDFSSTIPKADPENLGPGDVTLVPSKDSEAVWLIFDPERIAGTATYQNRWKLQPWLLDEGGSEDHVEGSNLSRPRWDMRSSKGVLRVKRAIPAAKTDTPRGKAFTETLWLTVGSSEQNDEFWTAWKRLSKNVLETLKRRQIQERLQRRAARLGEPPHKN